MGSAPRDDDFRRALQLAVADGLIFAPDIMKRDRTEPIREDDKLRARTAELILQSHSLVRTSGHVDDFRSRATEKVYRAGAITMEELREALKVDRSDSQETALAFDAGVADALEQGLIEWVPQTE